MVIRVLGTLAIPLAVAAISPATADERFEVPLNRSDAQDGHHSTLLLGPVGLDSHAGNSYRPARGDDPYYFVIPSQQPPKNVPGFKIRIPLGNSGPE